MLHLIREVARRWRNTRTAVQAGEGTRFRRLRIRCASNDRIVIGDQSMVEARIAIDRSPATVRIGSRTFIGRSVLVAAERITIGDDVLISWDVTIVDHDSHSLDFDQRCNDVVEWLKGAK